MSTRHAIIGDVHGCIEELEELCEFLLERDPDVAFVLTGDLLTKGPRPGDVVGYIGSLRAAGVAITSVCGNHDLRLFAALLRHQRGIPIEGLARAERESTLRLASEEKIEPALGLLGEIVDQVAIAAGDATVIHAGLRPELGLARTSTHDLVHLKANEGEPHWWDDYDGRDGLVVVGHKPMREPVYVRRAGRPIAINVDTGCVAGGRLTAYLPESDRFVGVESRQIDRRRRAKGVHESPASAAMALAS